MVSQWPVEIDDGGQRAQTPCGFPARIAAAIVIVAALVLVDGSKEMAPESQRTEQDRPSACGADGERARSGEGGGEQIWPLSSGLTAGKTKATQAWPFSRC